MKPKTVSTKAEPKKQLSEDANLTLSNLLDILWKEKCPFKLEKTKLELGQYLIFFASRDYNVSEITNEYMAYLKTEY